MDLILTILGRIPLDYEDILATVSRERLFSSLNKPVRFSVSVRFCIRGEFNVYDGSSTEYQILSYCILLMDHTFMNFGSECVTTSSVALEIFRTVEDLNIPQLKISGSMILINS